ncbi:MAG TPA: alanine--tRNA ligase [Terriglobales bacterium]|nr:alanine--tRNA ligase [Terriglobales bacterium]
MPTGSEIRRKFLDFFIQKGHREVHSSSLVPANDPTLLFTNAGMNQFKDVFLGLEKRDYARAATSQKCVRAGGKHNDLENVGFTNRHHTFFEMLGNFSFGDYFKKDAIAYAWELITSPEWFGIDKEKLYVTIFKGENGVPRDAEAYDLWLGQGVPKDHIYEYGAKDNFWQMGDTGPCGPCSEIHYDMSVAASDQGHGTTAPACEFGCDCGRYVELWNLVFMQFDRDASGKLNPLPKPSIDTGAGLERIASVLQGVISNYETDLFTPLIKRAAELTGTSLKKELDKEAHTKSAASLRVIADHSRAATFLISDGVIPSNEGRGYVLRKIMRRAITHGRLLGQTKAFLHEMPFVVRDLMQDAYPELKETAHQVSKVVQSEERRFSHTLAMGLQALRSIVEERPVRNLATFLAESGDSRDNRFVDEVSVSRKGEETTIHSTITPASAIAGVHAKYPPAEARDREAKIKEILSAPRYLTGEEAFLLYGTYGMPLDFVRDVCRDQGISFHEEGFESALQAERTRARASWKGAIKQTANPAFQQLPKSEFEGYRQTRSDNCEILAIIEGNQGAQELKPGDSGEIILDHTPFYAESGGQVGDRGWLYSDDHNTVVAEVTGCYYPVQGVRAHQVVAKQVIRIGQKVDAVVDAAIREATMRNHTATHLLQAGLREVLGKHVKQAGSLVAPNHLRFDFSHFTGVAEEELQDIEDIINKEVLRNERVEIVENVPIDVAVNEYHAMALFGEKYGDKVRVIRIGDFSTELCGGTHTGATGEIGLIKILKEGSVSSGVRRIEAITGMGSLRHFQLDHELEDIASDLAAAQQDSESLASALKRSVQAKDDQIKSLQRELDRLRMKSASSSVASVSDKVREVRGVKVLAHRVDNLERAQLRTLVDQLRDKLGSGVVVVGSAADGNVSLIAGVTKDLTGRIHAGKVVGAVAEKVGGKGGGRPDLAEAGGKDVAALDSALAAVYSVVESLLS